MEFIETFKNFFRDKNVAAITSSSGFAVKRICKKINFNKKNIIVEYGPGTGAYTKKILEKMTPDSHLILIETNPNFIKVLSEIHDPRISIYQEDAGEILEILKKEGHEQVDYIISGIPFSFLSKERKDEILNKTHQALKPDGRLLVYQTSNHIKPPLQKHFQLIDRQIEFLNLPPLFIFEAGKR